MKGARIRAGMVTNKEKGNQATSDMDRIKTALLPALRQMCDDFGVDYTTRDRVADLRLRLREHITEKTGLFDTLMDFGKYKDKEYQTVMAEDYQYCEWAIREVATAPSPDWKLIRFARWCEKVINGEME